MKADELYRYRWPLPESNRELPEVSGVYIITFDGTDYAYIGCSKCIAQRGRQHISEMRSGISTMNRGYKESGGQVWLRVLAVVPEHELPAAESDIIKRVSGKYKLLNKELWGKRHALHKRG